MRLAILICFFGVVARGATITASSASLADVNTALALCSDGDTLSIPAGSATWSSALTINNAITLQGAGMGQTIITPNANDYSIQITLLANKTNRITGIEFDNGTSAFNTIYVQGDNRDARRLRVDHCKWMNAPGALKLDTVLGVFDHNTIYGNAPGNKLAHIKCSIWNGLTKGNGAWTNATPLFGTENFFFFEDNILSSTNTVFVMSLVDAQAGGRYVFRFNTVTNAYIEGHGSEASYERSTHAVEVVGNNFQQQNVNSIVSFFRGGCGLILSNSISGVNGVANCLKLEQNRMNDSLFAPFGGSDGRNHWDVNDAGNPFATATATSAGSHTVTVSGATWTPSQWIGYTIRRTSGKTVTSVTRSSTTLTVVCTGHGFSTGDPVSLFGANQQEYNTLYSITVTDANTFTCSTVGALPTTPATGTIKAVMGTPFSEITANTGTQITFNASVYEAISVNYSLNFAVNDQFEINKVTHGMDMVGRTGGSRIDDTATPAFPAGWNDQTTSPWYQWQNNSGSQTGIAFGPVSHTIVEGLHFTNDVAKPGYTAYTYPHPLVSGGGGSTPGSTITSLTLGTLIRQ